MNRKFFQVERLEHYAAMPWKVLERPIVAADP